MSDAYLILADGTVFAGRSIGAKGKALGETVFTTGMTGYVETLTDPSYYGQIVTQTFPLIGNYGVMTRDFESKKSWVRGYIVRELCDNPSNFRCEGTLDDFLKQQGIIGICGIDTRALTKKLREAGVMNGMIISGKTAQDFKPDSQLLEQIKSYAIVDAVKIVNTDEGKDLTPGFESDRSDKKPAKKVVLFDFGAKANIQRELEKRGCNVKVVPYNTPAQTVLAMAPDGIMLSNGPGDPAENVGVIEEIRKLCEYGKIPVFGICLGHQMLALARGAKTSKLKYGHRGGNHPVKDTGTGRVYITSQNHGYAVEPASLPDFARLSFVNVNDETCEGVDYTDIPAFSVQFHPEACGGPHDTNFLFDRFLKMMEENHAS
ncbi:MAG: glutamine-hydrolyzing carbamoyl-phosphate synthase small subunit [Treponema sp.]|nr:glutamine-hydrolyzing carbamoyl-phosphate synthase small subunit [Treponema sp.]